MDARGYSFSARRLALAGSQTAVVIALGALAYRALARAIERNVGRWLRPHRRRSWALALTSAMARRASARARTVRPGPPARRRRRGRGSRPTPRPGRRTSPPACAALVGCAVAVLGFLAIAWLWELDLAFVRFLLGQPLWFIDDQTPVTVGDLARGRGDPPGGHPGLAAHEHGLRPDALPSHARRPRRAVRGGDALPLCGAGRHDPGRAGGDPARHGPDRRRARGPGRRAGLRPPGDRLQLRLRHHPAAGAADPHRRRGHGRGHHGAGRPHPHPRHHDRQRRQPEHDRPEPPVHHGQPGQLDAQGQDPARADQAGRRLRDRSGPRGRPADVGGAPGPGRHDEPGAIGDDGGVR